MTKSQGQNEKKTGSSSAEKPSKNPKEETGNNKKSDQPSQPSSHRASKSPDDVVGNAVPYLTEQVASGLTAALINEDRGFFMSDAPGTFT